MNWLTRLWYAIAFSRVKSFLAYKNRHRAKKPKKVDDWIDLSGAFNDGYKIKSKFWGKRK